MSDKPKQQDIQKQTTDAFKYVRYENATNTYSMAMPVGSAGIDREVKSFTVGDIIDQSINSLKRKFTMNRAFPSYKLYIIDEAKYPGSFGEIQAFNQTVTYYDVSDWLLSARVVRSRENPIDYCILQLDDSDGYLTGDGSYWRGEDSVDVSTINPTLQGGFIRDGVAVELRAGYENNPNCLETIFIGQITMVEGSDIITVECQGWGCELVTGPLTPIDKEDMDTNCKIGEWGRFSTGEASTANIIKYCIRGDQASSFSITARQPMDHALMHFGKSTMTGVNTYIGETNPKNVSEIMSRFASVTAVERTAENMWVEDLDPAVEYPVNFSINNIMPLVLTHPLGFIGQAGLGTTRTSSPGKYEFLDFNLYGLSLWEVLQQITLRHPGWVLSWVPYRTASGTEMTLFFGPPLAPYIWIGKSNLQQLTLFKAVDKENSYRPHVSSNNLGGSTLVETNPLKIAVTPGTNIRPFRQYHLITSEDDIIQNNIRCDAGSDDNTAYNAVKLYYLDRDTTVQSNGTLPVKDSDTKFVEVKADDSILPADTRTLEIEENNAYIKSFAIRMALGHLVNSLKTIYRGELIIVGNPDIKPHDTIILKDMFSGMEGPLDVREVVHSISPDGGFTTRIVPDLCVAAISYDTLLVTAAMEQFYLNIALNRDMLRTPEIKSWAYAILNKALGIKESSFLSQFAVKKEQANLAMNQQASSLSILGIFTFLAPFSALGFFAASKIAAYTSLWWIGLQKEAEPVVFLPLYKNNQVFISGLKGYNRDNNIKALTTIGWISAAGFLKRIRDLEEEARTYTGL